MSFYDDVDENALVEVACSVPDSVVSTLFQQAKVAKSTDEIVRLVKDFLLEGYSGQQVMERLLDFISGDNHLQDISKARCAMLFSQVDERLSQGCDEELQMTYLFSHLQPLLQAR